METMVMVFLYQGDSVQYFCTRAAFFFPFFKSFTHKKGTSFECIVAFANRYFNGKRFCLDFCIKWFIIQKCK